MGSSVGKPTEQKSTENLKQKASQIQQKPVLVSNQIKTDKHISKDIKLSKIVAEEDSEDDEINVEQQWQKNVINQQQEQIHQQDQNNQNNIKKKLQQNSSNLADSNLNQTEKSLQTQEKKKKIPVSQLFTDFQNKTTAPTQMETKLKFENDYDNQDSQEQEDIFQNEDENGQMAERNKGDKKTLNPDIMQQNLTEANLQFLQNTGINITNFQKNKQQQDTNTKQDNQKTVQQKANDPKIIEIKEKRDNFFIKGNKILHIYNEDDKKAQKIATSENSQIVLFKLMKNNSNLTEYILQKDQKNTMNNLLREEHIHEEKKFEQDLNFKKQDIKITVYPGYEKLFERNINATVERLTKKAIKN